MSHPLPALGPEMTIAHAAAWRDHLADAVARTRGDVTLDLAGVAEFDSSGVQLLLACRRSLADAGRRLSLHEPGPAVRDGLAVFGLGTLA